MNWKLEENVTSLDQFPGYYVNEEGLLFSDKYGDLRQIGKGISKSGYYCASLRKNGKDYKRYVHKLVAQTLIPNPENKSCVNHKNGNKLDNRKINLEWATKSEDVKHAYDTKLREPTEYKNWSAKKVYLEDLETGKIRFFSSIQEATQKTKVSRRVIIHHCKGRLQCYKRFVWRYANV